RLQHHSSSEIDRIDGRSVSYGRQIGQYDQDIACGQLKYGRYPSKNRTQALDCGNAVPISAAC
ncbi:hypothetical protein, partial [Rhizobium aouanii]